MLKDHIEVFCDHLDPRSRQGGEVVSRFQVQLMEKNLNRLHIEKRFGKSQAKHPYSVYSYGECGHQHSDS